MRRNKKGRMPVQLVEEEKFILIGPELGVDAHLIIFSCSFIFFFTISYANRKKKEKKNRRVNILVPSHPHTHLSLGPWRTFSQ